MATKNLTYKDVFPTNIVPSCVDVALDGKPYHGLTLHVKQNLELKDAMGFVQDIVTTCIDDEKADYMPESFEFAVRLYTLYHYANIDLTKNANNAYTAIYCTDLYDRVLRVIDSAQHACLISAASARIDHWRKMMESSVATKVMELMQKIDGMVAGTNEVIGAVNGEAFQNAVEQIKKYMETQKNENDDAHESEDSGQSTSSEAPEVPGNIVYLNNPTKK